MDGKATNPETLQSQNRQRAENKLTFNGLEVVHGRLRIRSSNPLELIHAVATSQARQGLFIQEARIWNCHQTKCSYNFCRMSQPQPLPDYFLADWPVCSGCGVKMRFVNVSNYDDDHDLRTFECRPCQQSEDMLVRIH